MKRQPSRYKVALVCLVLLVLPLFSMYFHGRTNRNQTLMETALVKLTAPGQEAMHAFFGNIVAVWKRYFYLVDVEEQNRELRAAIEQMKLLASRAQGLEEDNRRLREMLSFKQQRSGLELLSARAIARETSPFFSVSRIRLDQGVADKVTKNMPVVTAAGIVGRIEKVADDFCDVMLLTDSRARMDVQISGKGVTGTLAGTGDGLPVFRFPYQKARPEKGDILITTGHDRIFPKGLVAGYLATGEPRQVGQQLECTVEPAVRFSALQEVFVVLNQADAVVEIQDGEGVDR